MKTVEGFKICTKCEKNKSISFFRKHRRVCIDCDRIRSKLSMRKLSKGHKAKYMRNWMNTDKGKEYRLVRYKKAVESGYYKDGLGKYSNIRSSANKRGIEFGLTKEYFKKWVNSTPDTCFYCNLSFDEYSILKDKIFKSECNRMKNHLENRAKCNSFSIDRKDNEKGYIEGNIVKCCYLCNQIKGHILNEDEAKIICSIVINRLRNENQ